MPSIYFFRPVHSAAILDTLNGKRPVGRAPPPPLKLYRTFSKENSLARVRAPRGDPRLI